ncbi:MAG: hypothetical protein JWR80_2319 [Bradyrhizobium sp.]|nr:hypothetical protein [Bradyrhizobium sp.]
MLSNIDNSASGLSYHLPRTLLTLQLQPYGRRAQDVVAELTRAEAAAAGEKGVVRVSARIDGQVQSVLVNKDGALENDLVTSLRLVSATPDHVADLAYNYVLQYDPNAVFSDRVCMGVDEKGLLRYVQASTKDETANIIVSIAKFAARLAGPQGFTVGGAPQSLGQPLILKIDPYDESDQRAVSKAIGERFPELAGRFQFKVDDLPRARAPKGREACPLDRICYRTVVPVRVGLLDRASRGNSFRYAMVANLSEVNNIDVQRAFFVEKVTRLGFVSGMLAYAHIDKPSEALAVAKVPLTVYDAIVTSALAAPSQFVSQILPADRATLASLIALQERTAQDATELQGKLQDLRNDLPVGSAPTPTPEENARFRIACPGPVRSDTPVASVGSGGK